MERVRNQISLTIPEMSMIAGTRVLIGAGMALLLSDRFPHEQRRAVGLTMMTVGVLSSIPLIFRIFGEVENANRETSEYFGAHRAA